VLLTAMTVESPPPRLFTVTPNTASDVRAVAVTNGTVPPPAPVVDEKV
jgi:hypothetical protein